MSNAPELVHAPPETVIDGKINRQYPAWMRNAEGKPTPFPVNSAEEEAFWEAQGFTPAPRVSQTAFDPPPAVAETYVPVEYPMYLPNYKIIVQNETEHRARAPEDFMRRQGERM